jgi:hypothetical protein
MGPIGHFSVGLAAKPAVPKVPLGILLLATWILDVLAIVFGFAGIERGGSTEPSLSHGLFVSVIWSLVAAFLAARIYRDHRAGVVVGLLVFSHWVLDFVSHPMGFGHPQRPDLPLLFHGSRNVGLGLYNSISVTQAILIEVAMFIPGAAVYATYVIMKRKGGRAQPA